MQNRTDSMIKPDNNDSIWIIGHNMALFTAALDLTLSGIIVRMDYFLGDKAIIRIPGTRCCMALVKWIPSMGQFLISVDEAANLPVFDCVFLCTGMKPEYMEKYQIPSSAIPELNSKGKSDCIVPIKVEPETYIQFRVERFSNPLDMRKN